MLVFIVILVLGFVVLGIVFFFNGQFVLGRVCVFFLLEVFLKVYFFGVQFSIMLSIVLNGSVKGVVKFDKGGKKGGDI